MEQNLCTNKQMWPKFVCFGALNDRELATYFQAINPFGSPSPGGFEATYLREQSRMDSGRSNYSRYMAFALREVYTSLKTHLHFGGTC